MDAAFWPIVAVSAFFIWIVYVAVDLDVPVFLAKWYREPGNPIRVLTWIGSLFIVLLTLASPANSLLDNLRTDAITVAVTIIVIEELGRYRAKLEEKERLIRQMASNSNDFALDALRQIRENGWHKDGSLRGRQFVQANLKGANLEQVDMQHANLEEAILDGANLKGAYLKKANFFLAQMECATLTGANLEQAILEGTNLRKASLSAATLREASLVNASLDEAVLVDTNLEKACLIHASLIGAYLIRTTLKNADLEKASLMRTNLKWTSLAEAQLNLAVYSIDTEWPEGFDIQTAGVIPVDEVYT